MVVSIGLTVSDRSDRPAPPNRLSPQIIAVAAGWLTVSSAERAVWLVLVLVLVLVLFVALLRLVASPPLVPLRLC
jgi:hypothetical protein